MFEARWILCIVNTIVFHWNSIAANKIAHFTIDGSQHSKWQILMRYIAKFLPYPNIVVKCQIWEGNKAWHVIVIVLGTICLFTACLG